MRKPIKAQKREILPDLLYSSVEVTQLINKVMKEGKKEKASRLVYSAFEILKTESSGYPLPVFEEALKNVKPSLELKAKRVGGAVLQVPLEVRPERATTLAIRWIVEAARKKNGLRGRHHFEHLLASEIKDASKLTGEAFKKRETIHKMAISNMAFSRQRF